MDQLFTRAPAGAAAAALREVAARLLLLSFFLMPGSASALVGPARDAPELEPYVVMVLDRDGTNATYCSASVIDPRIVLTAGHCVTSPDDTRIHFRDEKGRPVLIEVDRIAVHPGYRPDAARRRLLSIDLALVHLAEPLPPRFRPVTLAESTRIETGETFRLAGFGIAEEGVGRTGGVLRMGIVTADGPMSSTLLWLRDPEDAGLGACTGDSGAPVFALNRPVVVAVAVWAKGEGTRHCGALTQAVLVAPQREWIDMVLGSWQRFAGDR